MKRKCLQNTLNRDVSLPWFCSVFCFVRRRCCYLQLNNKFLKISVTVAQVVEMLVYFLLFFYWVNLMRGFFYFPPPPFQLILIFYILRKYFLLDLITGKISISRDQVCWKLRTKHFQIYFASFNYKTIGMKGIYTKRTKVFIGCLNPDSFFLILELWQIS